MDFFKFDLFYVLDAWIASLSMVRLALQSNCRHPIGFQDLQLVAKIAVVCE